MSLLQQNSTEIDDAALGEEFTKGTTHLAWAAAIATILVSIGIALYFILGQKPPAAAGEIMQVWVEPLHSQTSGIDASGRLFRFSRWIRCWFLPRCGCTTRAKIRSCCTRFSPIPALVMDHLQLCRHFADYNRLFEAYPQLTSPHGAALASQLTIPPGQSVEASARRCARRRRSSSRIGTPCRATAAGKWSPQGAALRTRRDAARHALQVGPEKEGRRGGG